MSISQRVAKLRQESLDAIPNISSERAELITGFYWQNMMQTTGPVSAPIQRARAFEHLLERRSIIIQPGELIVGEKGHMAKATPTFPELCCHSLQDLEILDSREKISFKVSPHTRQVYQEQIIPFWQGKSMREMIFKEMTPEWLAVYQAGIFTEFMEQRAPGHTVLDDKIYHKGMLDFITEIETSLARLDYMDDPHVDDKEQELKAMRICAQAIIRFAERHAEKALEMAAQEANPACRRELEQIALVCSRVPANPPQTFWEALQAYWFVHLGVTSELNTWDAFNPGRLDQHLLPFYRKELEDGSLSREGAEELLQCFWIKFNNQPAPPKVGVTAKESGTYTDFALINTGGVTAEGKDAVNELTYLILDVVEEMRLLQPSSCLQISQANPDEFIQRASRIIRTGFGQPSLFNCDMVAQELVRQGKSLEDARNGGTSGCVEAGAFGKEAYILTGYLNLVKILEITLHNGIDPRSNQRLGPETGSAEAFNTFDDLFSAFTRQLQYFVDIKVRGNDMIERLYAEHMPAPFLSLLVDDCIQRGLDYHAGGARYNTSYIQGVGIGSLTDALTAIHELVFTQEEISLPAFVQAMDANYAGREPFRQKLLNRTPKFGNDDDRADGIMQQIFEAYFQAVDGRKNQRGGEYHINLLPTTVHVYFGSVTGATPDGRKAGLPLSEGISPVQGADRHGPTAVIQSAAKMDHRRTGGTLLNQKFSPTMFKSESDLTRLVRLVRSYFQLGGHHIQFNVVDAWTLRAAQANPEAYRGLIVRVAGYSDYFCDLTPALQEEIIARTEHEAI